MTKLRLVIAIITLFFVGGLSTSVFLYARGYRFREGSLRLSSNGLLVVKSDPDGAQVMLDGELKTATNANISLAPGTYDVSIRKESYQTWNKRLQIEREVVTQVDASLFPSAPSLSAVTFSGATRAVPTSELTKVAYEVPATLENINANEARGKAGLWLIELVSFPLGFTNEPRQITDADVSSASWIWSPDGREILLTTRLGVFLVDAGEFTSQNQLVNVASKKEDILLEWEKERKLKLETQLKKLPDELVNILDRKASVIVFSPDENKVAYTANGSEAIPEELIPPLPGASTQKQERNIKEGHTYVYDIKEDRNFLVTESKVSLDVNIYLSDGEVDETQTALHWFPTSAHLVLAEKDKVTILDYDGTNAQVVYSGSYEAPHAYPFVNRSQMLLLTSLGAESTPTNLYSLSLK